jgi:hypothetical protein
MRNEVYELYKTLGVDNRELFEEMATAANAVCVVAAIEKMNALKVDPNGTAFKGLLAEVAARHGSGLPVMLPEGITPDSPVYLLRGGTNGKRPDYLIVGENNVRIMAHGTFFGRESNFGLCSTPDASVLMRTEELTRLRYRAGQAALAVAKAAKTPASVCAGKIINMTPHPVNILDADNKEIARFESAGQIRLAVQTQAAEAIDGIPTSRTVFGAPEGLPEPSCHCPNCGEIFNARIADDGHWITGACTECGAAPEKMFFIVSQLIKSALPDRTDLLVPAEVVRNSSGMIIGCRSLGR